MKCKSCSENAAGIILFSIVAAFTSQFMVDLADILIIISSLVFAYKNREFNNFFKGFKPSLLWLVWLVIIFAGLIANLGFLNLQVWVNFIEFKWIITLLSMIYLVKKIEETKKLLKTMSVLLLVMNLISLFLNFYREGEGRAAGILNAVMAFSQNIAPIFSLFTVLVFVHWFYFNRNEKILVVSTALTLALLTLLTMTRGVWIGSAVAIITCLFIWNFKRAIQVTSVFVLVGVVLFFSSQRVQERVFSKTYDETSSNDVRRALWKANWRMVQDYPILGVGHGQNKNHLRKYYDELGYPKDMLISHAHNQYLQVWAGTGTLGFICYLVFLFYIFKTAWRGYKNALQENKGLMLGLISALLCFVIGALTEANFNISKNRFLFLLLAGLAIGFSDKVRGPVSAGGTKE